jgi:hypothetical protein
MGRLHQMQTFSGMQRNRTYQNALNRFTGAVFFVIYEALAMHYLLLPPLFGVLFFLYISALDRSDSTAFVVVLGMLLVAETAKGYLMLSTVVFYTLSYLFVLPKLRSLVSCRLCLNFLIVAYAYLGYWLFIYFVSQMFALPAPQIDFRVIFYILIEFFVVGLL